MVEKSSAHIQTVLWGWENVYSACYSTARYIQDRKNAHLLDPKEIIAVSRGGLIPATILSHLLSIPITGVIFPGSVHLITDNFSSTIKDVIIVDDICDTGRTFEEIKGYLPYAFRVCLCAKTGGKGHCESFALEYDDNQWIIFPWELDALP